uniref:Uncharacterized protein n=1 Tax=Aegilops tauschii subsp. strangulata TaxID=200361 RepID=A0A453D030_AEGTS
GLAHRARFQCAPGTEIGQFCALLSRVDSWHQEHKQGQPKEDLPPPPAKLRAATRKRCGQIRTAEGHCRGERDGCISGGAGG